MHSFYPLTAPPLTAPPLTAPQCQEAPTSSRAVAGLAIAHPALVVGVRGRVAVALPVHDALVFQDDAGSGVSAVVARRTSSLRARLAEVLPGFILVHIAIRRPAFFVRTLLCLCDRWCARLTFVSDGAWSGALRTGAPGYATVSDRTSRARGALRFPWQRILPIAAFPTRKSATLLRLPFAVPEPAAGTQLTSSALALELA